jgi:hypothetical protein
MVMNPFHPSTFPLHVVPAPAFCRTVNLLWVCFQFQLEWLCVLIWLSQPCRRSVSILKCLFESFFMLWLLILIVVGVPMVGSSWCIFSRSSWFVNVACSRVVVSWSILCCTWFLHQFVCAPFHSFSWGVLLSIVYCFGFKVCPSSDCGFVSAFLGYVVGVVYFSFSCVGIKAVGQNVSYFPQ